MAGIRFRIALASAAAVALAVLIAPATAYAVDTQMTIDTTVVAFGQTNVGNTSPTVSVTLTNSGADSFGPINMFGGNPPTTQFDASQFCQGVTLAPGGTCLVSYTFSPSAPGAYSDISAFTISATSSQAAGTAFNVSLTGCGFTPSTPCPTPTTTAAVPLVSSQIRFTG